MVNRIYITHSDRVSLQEAIEAVYVCLVKDVNPVNPGEEATLSNGVGVFYNGVIYKDKTIHSSFQVWREKE